MMKDIFSKLMFNVINNYINCMMIYLFYLKELKLNKKCNCSGPPTFKNQRVGYQSNQKLYIIVSIQIITSIRTFILKIQQILESRELKDSMPSLNRPAQKSPSQFLAFLNFYQPAKKQYARDSQFSSPMT